MNDNDEQNLDLVDSEEGVDSLNEQFYGRFPFPWPAMTYPHFEDARFESMMLNQSIGSWDYTAVPHNGRIWVAGCGTNQALYTALRFPEASVIGSDLSAASLNQCDITARHLRINNLVLRHESLNTVSYDREFDYVMCTGVIHHNAYPEKSLSNICRALKPDGLLELMVYNRFHRIWTSAFQKAVRLIGGSESSTDQYGAQVEIARDVLEVLPPSTTGPITAAKMRSWPDARLADLLIQPVEHSYTIESLCDLLHTCGLELLLPCHNQFDHSIGRVSWGIQIGNPGLRAKINGLPDLTRWQIINLLLFQDSPMLWFFVMRKRHDNDLFREARICKEFLDGKFERTGTRVRTFVRQGDGYGLSKALISYPPAPPEATVRAVVDRVDGNRTMRDILEGVGVDTTDHNRVNEMRILTTTSICPYLRIPSGH